jgi:branched-chain amino acid transport system permease protein
MKTKMKLLTGVGILALLLLIIVPIFSQGYLLRMFTFVFLFAVMAQSLNVIGGFAGYIPFGHMGFFGTGAYVLSVLMVKYSVNFPIALLWVIATTIVIAIVVGFPLFRLKGAYFAIGTIAFAGVMTEIVLNLEKFTGGGSGICLPQLGWSPALTNVFFYYFMFGWLALCTFIVYLISRNPIGYALRAIKDNENAALTTGVNTAKYKMLAWIVSAIFAAVSGGIYAYWQTFIDVNVYELTMLIQAWVILLIGGMGTVLGPIIGAFLIQILSEVFWTYFMGWYLGFQGLLIILVVLFLPEGVISLITTEFNLSKLYRKIKESRL